MPGSMVQYHIPPESLLIDGPSIQVAVLGTHGTALLDTGADLSSIDIDFAQELQLPVLGIHASTGATGIGEYPQFDAVLEIPLLETVVSPPLRGLPLMRPEAIRGTPSSAGMCFASSRC